MSKYASSDFRREQCIARMALGVVSVNVSKKLENVAVSFQQYLAVSKCFTEKYDRMRQPKVLAM